MSTRIHWAGEDGHRSCTHGRNATHKECAPTEFLRLPNLCRNCERAAQKSESLSVLRAFGAGKPKSLPAPQWPEPRPIAEAPTDGSELLLWFPGLGWIKSGWSRLYGWNASGYIPTHFLPLPPKPEVGKNDQSACPKCFEGYLESQGKGCLLRCVCCGARLEPNEEVIHYISQSGQPPKPEERK